MEGTNQNLPPHSERVRERAEGENGKLHPVPKELTVYNSSMSQIGFCGPPGDGTPLQYSCLENPMDGGAW